MKELHIRLEDAIFEQLQREAHEDERSLNKYIVRKLTKPYENTQVSKKIPDIKWEKDEGNESTYTPMDF